MSDGPILVIGASGFLGRTLIEVLAKSDRSAVGLSRVECDISNPMAVDGAIGRVQPRLIVNAAAFSGIDAAETERADAMAVNGEGPAILGSRAAAEEIPVIHISSDYVFDGSRQRPYREDDPVSPLGHYGQSKATGETRLAAVQPRHVILRTAWLFGDHGGGFVKMAIAAALGCQAIRTIVDQTGSPTAAVDLAGAILAVEAAIERGFQSWGIYHYAGQDPASRIDMVNTILDTLSGLGRGVPEIVPVDLADFARAALRPNYSALDSSRFVRTFDYPASDWRQQLAALVGRSAKKMTEQSIA